MQKTLMKLMAVCVFFLLNSCATPSLPTSNVEQEYRDFVNDSSEEKLKVPDAVGEALLGAGEFKEDNARARLSQRFDVSVNNIPARTFFVSLVAQAGVNVVAHPDIEGVVSLDLRNVSIDEVLNVVRDVYGYEYKRSSGIYTIYPRKLRTQIFEINYLDIKRVGVTDTSVLIGKITSNSGQQGGSRGGGGGGDSQSEDSANLFSYLGKESDAENSEGLTPGTRVQTLNTTDFWSRLEETLLGIVGGKEDGRFVMVNRQAGMVVVRALPVELSTVREFLDKSELSIQRQVILETKILEVQLNDRYESGINWAAISGNLSLEDMVTGGGTLDDVLIDGSGESEILFTTSLQVADITKLISLLDRQGDVSVLSSPRISTVNNQKAVIRVGTDEFFVTGISNSTTASAAAVTSAPEIELSSFFSGISLDVTPQIAEDGEVILHVHPIVSNVQDQLKEIQLGQENFSLPLALRDVRESDSIVRAGSGQVVVLGGLMQESSKAVDTRRSWLGNIPVINILFKHEEKSLKKTELVILMRPIVVDDGDWQRHVERGQSRFDDVRSEP